VEIAYPEDFSDELNGNINTPLEGRLAHYLFKEMYKKDDSIKDRIESGVLATAKLKLKTENIRFSVIRLNKNLGKTGDPIILVRNPEMGAQPSIVRPYERAIFRAISRLDEAHQPSSASVLGPGVRIHSFASGGAITPGALPGTITRPLASLYIGSEVDEHGRVYSVVNLVAIRNIPPKLWPQHVELYRDETIKTYVWGKIPITSDTKKEVGDEISKAVNDNVKESVQWFVLDSGDSLLESTLTCLNECYKLGSFKYEPIKLEEKILNSGIPEITANFSYFDDLATKTKLYEKFKGVVTNSNMEDYHVLRLARSMAERGGHIEDGVIPPHKYARLIDVEILRVNANVNIPLEGVRGALDKYLNTIRLSRQEYIESIMWGLKGCPLDKVSGLPGRVNKWGVYTALQHNEDLAKYVYVHNTKENTYCMDPFCCEIATDLVKDLANPDNKFPEELRNAAGAVMEEAKKHTWDDDWGMSAKLVEQLVALMYKWYRDDSSETDSMYCWLRPGKKWNGIGNNSMLTGEVASKFLESEENVDRLFYKSANLLALQKLAPIAAERSKILG
jgi:hypothetical protein